MMMQAEAVSKALFKAKIQAKQPAKRLQQVKPFHCVYALKVVVMARNITSAGEPLV